ncbi:MAG: 50S ribosomal protein L9 [Acidobacteriota bacterium]|nr:50S ribosomal protein L9 [Acidobacteriota bacterium]
MATTNVLLRQDVDNLGGRGEIVKVKSGYARNFLLPQGIATQATKGNIKQVEQERSVLLKKSASEKSTAEAQAEQMKDISLLFERKAGKDGTLFGSVTSMDIVEAIQAKGYEIDRRKIQLKETIKETGDYTVNVRLHREVTLEIPVSVTAEGEAAQEKTEKKAKAEESAETTEAETNTDEIASAEVEETTNEETEA